MFYNNTVNIAEQASEQLKKENYIADKAGLTEFFSGTVKQKINFETDSSVDDDIIHFKHDIILKDRNGNIIEINTPKPEYLIDSIL